MKHLYGWIRLALIGIRFSVTHAEPAVPFQVPYDADAVADLKQRLFMTRFPDELKDIGTEEWSYGAPLGVIKRLMTYLEVDYDWAKQVDKLNRMPQFTMQIGEHNVHYVHQRSSNKNAMPLMLIHGWPGSFWECSKILSMLTEPQLYGGSPEVAFHVVCPSIPGYGYSSKPMKKGFDQMECAKLFSTLMHELHYDKYYLQGGDWGSVVASLQASLPPSITHGKVLGLHLNMVPAAPPIGKGFMAAIHLLVSMVFPSWYYTPAEWNEVQAAPIRALTDTGYFHEQLTRPSTVAYGLSDSPIGLMAWIGEKFYEWSDSNGDLFSRFSEDEFLTNFMIYWTTNSAASSVRFYHEFAHGPNNCIFHVFTNLTVQAPTGMALFPVELFAPVRFWADYTYKDIIQWNHLPRGGHFAAMEEPLLLAKELWMFVEKINARKMQNSDEKIL